MWMCAFDKNEEPDNLDANQGRKNKQIS